MCGLWRCEASPGVFDGAESRHWLSVRRDLCRPHCSTYHRVWLRCVFVRVGHSRSTQFCWSSGPSLSHSGFMFCTFLAIFEESFYIEEPHRMLLSSWLLTNLCHRNTLDYLLTVRHRLLCCVHAYSNGTAAVCNYLVKFVCFLEVPDDISH